MLNIKKENCVCGVTIKINSFSPVCLEYIFIFIHIDDAQNRQ